MKYQIALILALVTANASAAPLACQPENSGHPFTLEKNLAEEKATLTFAEEAGQAPLTGRLVHQSGRLLDREIVVFGEAGQLEIVTKWKNCGRAGCWDGEESSTFAKLQLNGAVTDYACQYVAPSKKKAAAGATALLLALGFTASARSDGAVAFRSSESRTAAGGPVYNEITWRREQDRDLWLMNQSHHGAEASAEKWDRLAIVVEKREGERLARFYQLAPGPLTGPISLKPLPRRAACYQCHASGPGRSGQPPTRFRPGKKEKCFSGTYGSKLTERYGS